MPVVSSFSEVGGHRVNEDAFAVQQHPRDASLWVGVVADGQGGQKGGGPAARLACETARAAAINAACQRLQQGQTWSGILRLADERVRLDPEAGFTTLVGLCVTSTHVIGASNGDSAAVLFCRGDLLELTASQSKNPPIGSGSAAIVSFETRIWSPWKVLAMSDGVWKYIGWERIKQLVRDKSGESLIANLQEGARLLGSGQFQDDFTVVLLEGEGDLG